MFGKVEKLNRSLVAEKVHKTLQQYEFNTISDRLYMFQFLIGRLFLKVIQNILI